MITLVYPKETANRYLFFMGAIFGPMDNNGAYASETIPFESDHRFLAEERGIYHENFVNHIKTSGYLSYIPARSDLVPVSSDQYSPCAAKLPTMELVAPGYVTARYGLATDHGSSYIRGSLSGGSTQYAFERIPGSNFWNLYIVQTQSSSPYKPNSMQLFRLTLVTPWSGTLKHVFYDQSYYDVNKADNTLMALNWSTLRSYDEITNLFASTKVVSMSKNLSSQGYLYTLRSSGIWFPQKARSAINSLFSGLYPRKFPCEGIHYGDLAMRATSNVNANHVNMIAFLRDLRDPKAMIPKLRELRNLKGIANNYLTVNYGILPTISDLQNIYKAMTRRKPHFDSNGWKTCNATQLQDKIVDNYHYYLEQRIKLAIADEDNVFERLIQSIDNVGMFPTFKNVWDLIPYSFVIDWFADIGDLLARVDTHLRVLHLNIRYATMSRKERVTGFLNPSVELPFDGSVELVHYRRWVSGQCPVPPLSLQPNPEPFNHWLEGGALIIQRTK